MDKNKTIIVILTIVIVVAAVLGVGLWVFYPRNPPQLANTPTNSLQYVQGNGNLATPESGVLPSATPLDMAMETPQPTPLGNVITQQVVIVDGSSTENRAANEVKNMVSSEPTPSPVSGLVVSGGANARPAPASSKPRAVQASIAPSRDAPARVKSSAKLPAAAPAIVPARHGSEFWIQVISSPNKDRVEQVRKELGSLGFNGLISTYNKSGSDFYRLRYGPYFAVAEAEKFKEWVKMIKGLEASYVVKQSGSKK